MMRLIRTSDTRPDVPGYAVLMRIEFESTVIRWEQRVDSWFFATMPEELSVEIRELPAPPRGFGSLRVRATIGGSTWSTSIFYSAQRMFLLPLKKAIRQEEGIEEGDTVLVALDIIDL